MAVDTREVSGDQGQPRKPKWSSRPVTIVLTLFVVMALITAIVIFTGTHSVVTTKTVAVNPLTGSTVPVTADPFITGPPPDEDTTPPTAPAQFALPQGQTDPNACPLPGVSQTVTDPQQQLAAMFQLYQMGLYRRNPDCIDLVDTNGACCDNTAALGSENPFGAPPQPIGLSFTQVASDPGSTSYNVTVAGVTTCAVVVEDSGLWKFTYMPLLGALASPCPGSSN